MSIGYLKCIRRG